MKLDCSIEWWKCAQSSNRKDFLAYSIVILSGFRVRSFIEPPSMKNN